MKNKKKVITPSDFVLYTYITFTPRKFCVFVCKGGGIDGGGPSEYIPVLIFYFSCIFLQYADNNGGIRVARFEDIIESHRTNLNEITIRKLLIYADDNRDGYISRNEMISLVNMCFFHTLCCGFTSVNGGLP